MEYDLPRAMAYRIFHLKQNCLILGEAGTGKSYFAENGLDELMMDDTTVKITGDVESARKSGKGWQQLNEFTEGILHINNINPRMFDVIKSIGRFVIDEFNACDGLQLDLLHDVCCRVKLSDLPFGGIQYMFLGDPNQKKLSVGKSFSQTNCWNAIVNDKNCRVIYFTQNRRFNDPERLTELQNITPEQLINECRPESEASEFVPVLSSKSPRPSMKTHDVIAIDVIFFHKMDAESDVRKRGYGKDIPGYLTQTQFPRLKCEAEAIVRLKENDFVTCIKKSQWCKVEKGEILRFLGHSVQPHPSMKHLPAGIVVQDAEGKTFELGRESFSIHDHNGVIIGHRMQLPIKAGKQISLEFCRGITLHRGVIFRDHERLRHTKNYLYILVSRLPRKGLLYSDKSLHFNEQSNTQIVSLFDCNTWFELD